MRTRIALVDAGRLRRLEVSGGPRCIHRWRAAVGWQRVPMASAGVVPSQSRGGLKGRRGPSRRSGARRAARDSAEALPSGRGCGLRAFSATETAEMLAFLVDVADVVSVKATEAPAFRRAVLSRRAGGDGEAVGALCEELRRRRGGNWAGRLDRQGMDERSGPVLGRHRSRLVVGEGKSIVFVSHRGDVQPSGLLLLTVGNVPERYLSDIYTSVPVLHAERPGGLTGRCGRCSYWEVCVASRTHTFAYSGDPLGEEITYAYEPADAEHIAAGG